MSISPPNVNQLSLRSILMKDKLNNTNFLDWYRNLRIVLRHERKLYILEGPVPSEPPSTASPANHDVFQKHLNESVEVSNLMLDSMETDLRGDLVFLEAFDILLSLKCRFQYQLRQELFETNKTLYTCKMAKGTSVKSHLRKMEYLLDKLERLNCPIDSDLAEYIILNSLSSSYDQFVSDCYMGKIVLTISELTQELESYEKGLLTRPFNAGTIKISNSKGKDKIGVSKVFLTVFD